MTHFPTLSYTSASEISTLLYTCSLKKVPLSGGASPYRSLCGVPTAGRIKVENTGASYALSLSFLDDANSWEASWCLRQRLGLTTLLTREVQRSSANDSLRVCESIRFFRLKFLVFFRGVKLETWAEKNGCSRRLGKWRRSEFSPFPLGLKYRLISFCHDGWILIKFLFETRLISTRHAQGYARKFGAPS